MNIEGENAKLVRSLVFAFIEYLFTGCSAFCFQHQPWLIDMFGAILLMNYVAGQCRTEQKSFFYKEHA